MGCLVSSQTSHYTQNARNISIHNPNNSRGSNTAITTQVPNSTYTSPTTVRTPATTGSPPHTTSNYPSFRRPLRSPSSKENSPSLPRTKPLKRAQPWTGAQRNGQPWTRESLDREREDFFDTRVTGREEVWQSLRAALDFLWNEGFRVIPGPSGEVFDAGVMNAQAILEAADVIVVGRGDLVSGGGRKGGGVYDRLGNLYVLPEWVVSDPSNLMVSVSETEEREMEVLEEDEDMEKEMETEKSIAARRREKKGKGVALPDSQLFRVKVRLSDGRPDKVLKVVKDQSTWFLQQQVRKEFEIPQSTGLTLVYLGHLLPTASSLLDMQLPAWVDGYVINCFLSPGNDDGTVEFCSDGQGLPGLDNTDDISALDDIDADDAAFYGHGHRERRRTGRMA